MEDKKFDLKGIQPKFEELIVTTSNKLEREFPQRFAQFDSAQLFYMLRFRLVVNTYNAILYLCADLPKDPHRSPKFIFAIPPMVRTLFEELITVIFLLHDTGKYLEYLYKTDYNEKKRALDFARKYHSGKTSWDEYIDSLENELRELEKRFKLTEKEFKSLGKYPTTGQMINQLEKDFPTSNVLPFLQFIKTWIYRELSGQTHLDIRGFQNKSIHFSKPIAKKILKNDYEKFLEDHLMEYKANQMYVVYTLLLALITEMNRAFNFKMNQRLIYVWEIFIEFSDTTKDFYNERYRNLLR